MQELKPGCHYFLAIQAGRCDHKLLWELKEYCKTAGIGLFVLEVYDKPSECMNFREAKEKVNYGLRLD